MRPIKSLTYGLLIAVLLSVTSSYGSSPPGNVSKIERVKEPICICGIMPAILEVNQVVSSCTPATIGLSQDSPNYEAIMLVATTKGVSTVIGRTIIRQVRETGNYNYIKDQLSFVPRKTHSLHIDPGLNDEKLSILI